MTFSISLRRVVAGLLACSLAVPTHFTAWAATHPLTGVRGNDVNTLDYVVNTDWDFDNPPLHINNPAQTLNRAYITAVIRQAALSKFTMTEGRHRMGTVYVYRNGLFGRNVDIRLLNSNGRSSANAPGWGLRDGSSFNYLSFQGTAETIQGLGQVIAHELGHYTYALFDEYVEAGTPLDPQNPSQPSQVDHARNTLMNDQYTFARLSGPADYLTAGQRNTAQSRMYATRTDLTGGSAWETLVRAPSQDPANARDLGRTFFDAFRGVDPLNVKAGPPVSAGFDAALNIVFVPNPQFREVLVVDPTLPAARVADLVQAAIGIVNQAPATHQFAVLNLLQAAPVLGYTVADANGKTALIAALRGIAQGGSPTNIDWNARLTDAFNLAANGRNPGDLATFHLLTGNEVSVDGTVVAAARTQRVALNALGLAGGTSAGAQATRQAIAGRGGVAISLAEAANRTGGVFAVGTGGSDAARSAARAAGDMAGTLEAAIAETSTEPLRAGQVAMLDFRVASTALDSTVTMEVFFDPADAARLSFSVRAPNGTVYPSNALPPEISFDLDADEGNATFVLGGGTQNTVNGVGNARQGMWRLMATAASATTDGVALEVTAESTLDMALNFRGGTTASGGRPVLVAQVSNRLLVRGATLVADVFDESGVAVLRQVALRDDGRNGDRRANDGEYTALLDGVLGIGSFFAEVSASSDGNATRLVPFGMLRSGPGDPDLPVEAFQRVATTGFATEAGAPGVTTTPSPFSAGGGGSGGCVAGFGKDATLLLLLAAAVTWALRRRYTSRP